jgi:hypothetical protein
MKKGIMIIVGICAIVLGIFGVTSVGAVIEKIIGLSNEITSNLPQSLLTHLVVLIAAYVVIIVSGIIVFLKGLHVD